MTVDAVPASVFDGALPTLVYDDTETPEEMYPRIRAAQRLAPIAIGPHGPEVLSYQLARAVLRDTRFRIPPGMGLATQDISSGPLWDKLRDNVSNSLLCLEGKEHYRLRSLVSKAFTSRATSRLHDTTVAVMNELVDRVADGGCCDVVTDIARPYPVPIICALLGAPREDWQQFHLWADEIPKPFGFTFDVEADLPVVMRAWGEFADYVGDMIALRRRDLTDDLLSDLIRAEDDGDRLNTAELRMLAASLLLAGTDTTRNQLAASVHVLCEHPEQWAVLKEHPELAKGAVEEAMRYSPTVCRTIRRAVEDVELGGYIVPAGTMVLVNIAAGNRDPAVYADPDRFDITRAAAPAVLSFGGGAHYCLGVNLARLELAEALKILVRRMLNPRIVGPAPWKPMGGVSGPRSLPIEFDTDR